jgi:hypothetical protein
MASKVSMVSLDASYAPGKAWTCKLGKELECGTTSLRSPKHLVPFAFPDGVREAPFVSWWPQRSKEGFDGMFYVGVISASPPAVLVKTSP